MASSRFILAAVGLPFLLFGLGMTGYAARQAWRFQAAKAWAETTATIDTVSLESHRSERRSGGRRRSSQNYSVAVTYRYMWQGQQREGHAATLYNMRDNARSYHQAVRDRIEGYRARRQPMPCFVHPGRPDDAVLIREPRWGHIGFLLLFGLVFSGIGAPLALGVFRGRGPDQVSAWLRAQHPDEPWRVREDWASGVLKPSGTGFPFLLTAVALLWNASTWPVAILAALNRPTLPDPMGWIVFLYPLLAALLLAWAVYEMLNHRKFRGARLELDTVPAEPGHEMRGRIVVPSPVLPREGFVLTLSAHRWEEYRTSKGKRGHRQVDLWNARHVIKDGAAATRLGTTLPFAIEVPANQPATDIEDPEHGVRWHLLVEANLPGVDLHHRYDVPVFPRRTT